MKRANNLARRAGAAVGAPECIAAQRAPHASDRPHNHKIEQHSLLRWLGVMANRGLAAGISTFT
jgi:hypothetical protein